ncbi:MAG: adenylate kinase [Candidatus Aminicenantaceae bacterium]
MRIVLLGPPGSGKGTQAGLLEKRCGFPVISTGDLLRQAVQNKTPLGEKVKSVVGSGELVSDEIMIKILKKRLLEIDCKNGYILDGYPRNIAQVKILEEINGHRKEVVIELYLERDAIIERLGARRVCTKCGAIYNMLEHPPKKKGRCDICQGKLIRRDDDKPKVIKERIKIYNKEIGSVIDYYKRKNVYHRVDAQFKINEVFDNICSIIEKESEDIKEVGSIR